MAVRSEEGYGRDLQGVRGRHGHHALKLDLAGHVPPDRDGPSGRLGRPFEMPNPISVTGEGRIRAHAEGAALLQGGGIILIQGPDSFTSGPADAGRIVTQPGSPPKTR